MQKTKQPVFAYRFKNEEQKDKATKEAKKQNRSLNGYISSLIDEDLELISSKDLSKLSR